MRGSFLLNHAEIQPAWHLSQEPQQQQRRHLCGGPNLFFSEGPILPSHRCHIARPSRCCSLCSIQGNFVPGRNPFHPMMLHSRHEPTTKRRIPLAVKGSTLIRKLNWCFTLLLRPVRNFCFENRVIWSVKCGHAQPPVEQ